MINLAQFDDDVILTTREVALWLGVSMKEVGRRGYPLANVPGRGHRYLAGDIKATIRQRPAPGILPLRRAS